MGDVSQVGKYSFDVDLGRIIPVNSEGFYERDPLIKFFVAVESAATSTAIEWVAFYNDFEVIEKANKNIGKHRLGFSGGQGSSIGGPGSIHHGPAPYILHVHFNIMPTLIAGEYILGKKLAPFIKLGP